MSAAGWGKLITPLKWFAKAGLRFIPYIGWALLAADIWSYIIKPLGWDEYISKEKLLGLWNSFKGLLNWSDIFNVLEWTVFLPVGALKAAWKVQKGEANWEDIIDEIPWMNWFDFEWKNLLPSWSWVDIIPSIPGLSMDNLFGRHASEDQLMAQGSRHGQTVAPHSTEEEMRAEGAKTAATSPDQAARIQAMLDRNAALHAARLAETLKPITLAIREGKEQVRPPEISVRPVARPEPQNYEAPQPNVTVESTFKSEPKVDVNVAVNMPVHIKREQRVDNRKIAAQAGKQAGAATERAVRCSLDDSANVE